MKRTRIDKIGQEHIGQLLSVAGWIRTVREQKECCFLELNDGSCLHNLQIVFQKEAVQPQEDFEALSTGVSVFIKGKVVKSPGNKQAFELQAETIEVLGKHADNSYVLQKKRHSFEFLRSIAHLRPRTQTQGAVLRMRNHLAFATHRFFQEEGFIYVHTPLITSSDCEGGGEQFLVTTLDLKKPLDFKGNPFAQDFFHKPAYLTVSGQLNGEALACAMGNIYTFGPTFRAENSNTSRHLAEFWMIEPEMAFADLEDNMECAEKYIHFLVNYVLEKAKEDLLFFDTWIEKNLLQRLEKIIHKPFAKLSYTQAIDILLQSSKPFLFPVKWGIDLQSEHERFLAEEYCKGPVIIYDYPADIKSFYMRDNPDGKTVAAMDILVPKIGEIIGGSQREERYPQLIEKIERFGLKAEDYTWYTELRKYGSVPHAGFGAGFERLIQFVTGMENIRDVIPFPRYPGHAEF